MFICTTFDFTYNLGSGVESAIVKKLRLSSRINKSERISLFNQPHQGSNRFIAATSPQWSGV